MNKKDAADAERVLLGITDAKDIEVTPTKADFETLLAVKDGIGATHRVKALEQALAAERERGDKMLAAYEVMKADLEAAEDTRDAERSKRKCHRYDPIANDCWCEREDYIFRQPAIVPSDEPMAKPQGRILALRNALDAEREKIAALTNEREAIAKQAMVAPGEVFLKVKELQSDLAVEREQRLAAEAEVDAIDEALDAIGANPEVSNAQAIRDFAEVYQKQIHELEGEVERLKAEMCVAMDVGDYDAVVADLRGER